MRELREFRVHHAELVRAGVALAGVTTDPLEDCRRWADRLELPYPLLSDSAREAGRAFRVVRQFGLGTWKVELFRRTTFLADANGVVRAVWGQVKMRGHAIEVLRHARALAAQD